MPPNRQPQLHCRRKRIEKVLLTLLIEPTEESILKVWDFCVENSRSIEVVYRDEDSEEEVLTRVHFNVNIKVREFSVQIFQEFLSWE